jgi:hypothetical protein
MWRVAMGARRNFNAIRTRLIKLGPLANGVHLMRTALNTQALTADLPYRTDSQLAQHDWAAWHVSLRGADVDEFVVADAEWLWHTLCQLLQFVLLVALAVLALALVGVAQEAAHDTAQNAAQNAAQNPAQSSSQHGRDAALYASFAKPTKPEPTRRETYAGP